MTLDDFVFDIMSFPWIGLLILVAVLFVGLTVFYLSFRWFVRSIKRDLDRQEQQKSKQKKQQ